MLFPACANGRCEDCAFRGFITHDVVAGAPVVSEDDDPSSAESDTPIVISLADMTSPLRVSSSNAGESCRGGCLLCRNLSMDGNSLEFNNRPPAIPRMLDVETHSSPVWNSPETLLLRCSPYISCFADINVVLPCEDDDCSS